MLRDPSDHIVQELRQWLFPVLGGSWTARQDRALGRADKALGVLYQAPSLTSSGSTTHTSGAEQQPSPNTRSTV